MNSTQQHQIEAFLRGELNPEQLKEFNQLLADDPSFAQNVRFEQNIVNGLSQVRKAELKARLDAIDVAPTGWYGLGQLGSSTLVKTLGGLAVASVVGVLIYTNLDDTTPEFDQSKVITTEVDYPTEEQPIEFNWDLKESEVAESVEKQYNEQSEPELIAETVKPAAVAVEEKSSKTEEFDVTVNVPQPDALAKEEGLVTPESDLPEMETTDEVANTEVAPVDVETIQKKNETLKYKYFDGKLFLYGDFNEQPYEILEINGVKERKLYLFFESKYFNIDVTDKVKELDQIVNPKLVNELDIIRNNK